MNTIKIAFIAVALSLIPVPGFAQQSASQEVLKRSCTADYLEHCSEFAPGGSEVEMCFKEKASRLSPGCSSAILAYKQEQKMIKQVSAGR